MRGVGASIRADRARAPRGGVVEGIASGDVALRVEDINDVLLDKITGAADRLTDRDLTFERLELPSSSGRCQAGRLWSW